VEVERVEVKVKVEVEVKRYVNIFHSLSPTHLTANNSQITPPCGQVPSISELRSRVSMTVTTA
jgi:hypothetical protein